MPLMLASGCARESEKRTEDISKLSAATSLGRFTDGELVEASGLAQSVKDSNVFWAQNDSGNDPLLFAFDSTGRALGTVRVDGARNRDWEALSIGPCDSGSCIYIGDVGDNEERRAAVSVLRVPEPTIRDSVTAPAERLVLRYADGPHDVESMWVAPDSAIYFLTKRPARDESRGDRPARIYRIAPSAWHTGDTATAVLVDSIPVVPLSRRGLGWITDAALSPRDGSGAVRLAARTYRDVYVFAVDSLTWRPISLIARCSLRELKERDGGEGLTWLPDGRLMFDAEGRGARLHAGRCP